MTVIAAHETWLDHNHRSTIEANRAIEQQLKISETKIKANSTTNSWSWGSFGFSSKPKPPSMGFVLPFGFVLPAHWVETYTPLNNVQSHELFMYHQLSELCLLSDLILIIAVSICYMIIGNTLFKKFLANNPNKFFKDSKYTKIIIKYLESFIRANNDFWILFVVIGLVICSFKSQQYHLELLNYFTAHMPKDA
ncbi:hypothetical protein EON73_05795 [bacterium]|nr:MAG: hypothetical protein EON73_05795 [bacterium]